MIVKLEVVAERQSGELLFKRVAVEHDGGCVEQLAKRRTRFSKALNRPHTPATLLHGMTPTVRMRTVLKSFMHKVHHSASIVLSR